MNCKINSQDEDFEVQVSEDQKKTTVTDKRRTEVTITWNSGNYNVRLPNGWGGWEKTIEGAVNRAVSLCIEYRSQLTEDDAVKEMVSYVKNCEGSE